jgi:hypothetical protein
VIDTGKQVLIQSIHIVVPVHAYTLPVFQCQCQASNLAALLYLITDNFWAASIIPLYPLAAKIFWEVLTAYLDDVDEWRDWEIERTAEGLRFHYKNTGSNVLFSDLSKLKVDSKNGEIAGLTLTLKNGQRIGVNWYNDMNALYQHLLSGVDHGVKIII